MQIENSIICNLKEEITGRWMKEIEEDRSEGEKRVTVLENNGRCRNLLFTEPMKGGKGANPLQGSNLEIFMNTIKHNPAKPKLK